MILAIIPARGGSKRIPKKNIKSFCGKPIIAYSIEAAKATGLFDHVIVSTDCEEIKAVALDFGAAVPFQRPLQLSDDHTPTMPVIRHAINWSDENFGRADHVCVIYATAPFVNPDDLRRGYALLTRDENAEFCFSVTTFPFPILRGLTIDGNRVKMLWPENELVRSQDLVEAYHDAGQFYWGTATAFETNNGFFSANSVPIVLPRSRVQDVDTPEDWFLAEHMFRAQHD